MRRRSTSLKRSLTTIDHAFGEIEAALAMLAMRVRSAARTAMKDARGAVKTSRPRRQLTLTPKRRAQLKLQGAYMGYMRQLGPRQQARVKAVKEKRGFEAAIMAAKRMTGR
jgi:hypothetical protein